MHRHNPLVYLKRYTAPKVSKKGIKIPTNLKETWVHYVAEVFRNMSLGGFIHFTYIGRHPVEFILWFLVMCTTIVCAILLCLHNWERYMDNPTVIAIESNYREWNISFPSLFICSEKKTDEYVLNKVSNQVASDFNMDLHIVSSFLTALANLSYFNLDTMRNFSKEINIPPENYLQLVKEVSYKDYDIQTKIEKKLIPVYTEFGFCYADNSQFAKMIARNITKQADVADLFRNDPPLAESYLRLIDPRILKDVNTTSLEAFIVSPWEVPTVGGLRFSGKSRKNHSLAMTLRVSELIATQAVRDLNINHRKCRFYDESNLKISQLYSLSFCRIQCRIDLAVEKCGCAPFFYEGILEVGYKICDVEGMQCLAKFSEELILGTNHTCNCYPTCENSAFMFSRDPEVIDVTKTFHTTPISWQIKNFPSYRSKRDVLFTFSDMLVGFGGIAGLFLGFSMLSIVEIVYYVTLRPFFYMREMNQLRKENDNRRRIMSF